MKLITVKKQNQNYQNLKNSLDFFKQDQEKSLYYDYNGDTLLHLAAKDQNFDVIKAILDTGVSPNLPRMSSQEDYFPKTCLEIIISKSAYLSSVIDIIQEEVDRESMMQELNLLQKITDLLIDYGANKTPIRMVSAKRETVDQIKKDLRIDEIAISSNQKSYLNNYILNNLSYSTNQNIALKNFCESLKSKILSEIITLKVIESDKIQLNLASWPLRLSSLIPVVNKESDYTITKKRAAFFQTSTYINEVIEDFATRITKYYKDVLSEDYEATLSENLIKKCTEKFLCFLDASPDKFAQDLGIKLAKAVIPKISQILSFNIQSNIIENIYSFGAISEMAYEHKATIDGIAKKLGFTNVNVIIKKSIQSIVMFKEKYCVIAFRGTDNLQNKIDDTKISTKEFHVKLRPFP